MTYQGNNQHDDTPSNLPLNDDNDEQMPELNEASDSENEEEEFESEKKEECHATQVCCIEQNCLKEYSEHKCLDTTKKHINKCKQFKTGHCIGGKHIQCCIEYENDKNDNVCRLPLEDENEVNEKKKMFCSMYQPFDTSDDKRITNFAMFYIRNDIGRDAKFVEVLSKGARFIADDICYRTSPMFTGNDFSLQTIDDMSGKKESVLVAKVDSSAKSYLRSGAGNCGSTEWLPHVTLKFGIYVDKNNCCPDTKNVMSCHQCSSKNAPKPLDHHYKKEPLFYEMTVTGKVFDLKLDGNPILASTKYTLLEKTNSLKPKNGEAGEKLMKAIETVAVAGKENDSNSKADNNNSEEKRNRRDDWNEFTTYVETTQGTCNSQILQDVSVHDDGSFSFQCSQAAALCNCIQHVGGSGEEQHFVAGNIGLIVFRQDGLVGYEITEDRNAVAYDDVNGGRMGRRRRRLLQHGGGES